jgi:organic radical activating enzyme
MQSERETPTAPQASPDRGYLSEMFCSIQGEGPFVGERHVFVRTAGCTATCRWCDTVYSKVRTPRFVIHDNGSGKRPLENPVAIGAAADAAIEFAARHHPVDAVSITGGEPLEQPDFVVELARRLHGAGQRVYLETNGVHAGPLAAVLPYVNVVAMDIKLPSAVGVEMWDDHRRFLSVLCESGRRAEESVFVKIVMDAHSRLDELDIAAELIAAANPAIPLILQPESETLLSVRTPRSDAVTMMATIEAGQRRARRMLDNVRVMPQFHKIMKVR